jgi:drug/metabolite transporter (DMT)-like permease
VTTATRTQLDWRIQYAMLALIWGSSFLFIVIAVEVLDPLQVAFGRVAIGAATLLVILRVLRQSLPRGASVWGHLLVAGLFYNVVPFALLAYAGQRVPSALSGLLNATTPLFTLVIALAVLPSERPTRQRALGLAVGFFGVLIIFGVGALSELTGTLPGGFWAGSAMVLGASACYGLASVYSRITLAGPARDTPRSSCPPVRSPTRPPSWWSSRCCSPTRPTSCRRGSCSRCWRSGPSAPACRTSCSGTCCAASARPSPPP